jgi:hypothetical protein
VEGARVYCIHASTVRLYIAGASCVPFYKVSIQCRPSYLIHYNRNGFASLPEFLMKERFVEQQHGHAWIILCIIKLESRLVDMLAIVRGDCSREGRDIFSEF